MAALLRDTAAAHLIAGAYGFHRRRLRPRDPDRSPRIMAKRGSAQSKLDRVVDLIAEAMGSDVCSIYLLRDNVLELFATHGLRKEAVHVTRLRMGEGLVGTIAAEGRILNLAEAAQHPAFAYRPETAEDRFHSFAGVPIVRLESSIGVLAVQNAEPRRYEDVEIEALQTVAMVLSEMIGAARLVDGARRSRLRSAGPLRLSGLKLVSGMAKGQAVFHEPRVVVEHTVAEDAEAERERVYAAFRKMREQIDNMAKEAEFGTVGEHQEILETYRMFAYDEGWSRRINTAIDSGLTAEAAIERVQQRTRARMQDDRRSAPERADARSRGPIEPAPADRVRANGHCCPVRPCA